VEFWALAAEVKAATPTMPTTMKGIMSQGSFFITTRDATSLSGPFSWQSCYAAALNNQKLLPALDVAPLFLD
jgi:hypothetical protein